MEKPINQFIITRDRVLYRHFLLFCSAVLLSVFTLKDAAYAKRLTPQKSVCVSGLEQQKTNAELFEGKLQLEVRKNPRWDKWDARFSDVVVSGINALNSKQNNNSSKLHFLIAPSSSAKRSWQHIIVGLGICTTVGKKICKGGTFRFPMSQNPVSAAKSVMEEMFGSGGQFPACKEEWFDMD